MPMQTNGPCAFLKPCRRATALPLAAVLLAGTLLWAPAAANGQTAGVNQGGPGYIHSQAGLDPNSPQNTSSDAQKIEQMRKAEQHRRVVEGAARLLVLSNELKAEIDAMPKDQLSLDIIRKAAEIEKLAHDVKGWMKS